MTSEINSTMQSLESKNHYYTIELQMKFVIFIKPNNNKN